MVAKRREPHYTRLPADYGNLLGEIKARIRSAQYEACKAVNKELVGFTYALGRCGVVA